MTSSKSQDSSLGPARIANLLRTTTRSCPDHGPYQAYGIEWPTGMRWSGCPQCSAHAEREALARRTAETQYEARQTVLRNIMEASGITGRLQEASFDRFETPTEKAQRALSIAMRYVSEWETVSQRGVWMAILGLAGTGKTYLAACIARALIEKNKTVLMIRALDLSSRLRSARLKGEANPYTLVAAPDLVIVDEMSLGELDADLYLALDTRYMLRKPTILIANHHKSGNQSQLLAAFDHRIADRIRDQGGVVLYCDWTSFRAKYRQGEGWLIREAPRTLESHTG